MFFRRRTITTASEALRQTTDAFPEDSTEYFPATSVMQATLGEQFDVMGTSGWKRSLNQKRGEATPELCAYHLLDITGRLFQHSDLPHMAQWCFAAMDTLE